MDFSLLSLIAVGGAITVIPEMHRSVVEVHGWMSGAQFADLFALAQAAPGPNILVVSLIGWKVAGLGRRGRGRPARSRPPRGVPLHRFGGVRGLCTPRTLG